MEFDQVVLSWWPCSTFIYALPDKLPFISSFPLPSPSWKELQTVIMDGEKRNWKGMLIAVLVILVMCSVIGVIVYYFNPQISEYNYLDTCLFSVSLLFSWYQMSCFQSRQSCHRHHFLALPFTNHACHHLFFISFKVPREREILETSNSVSDMVLCLETWETEGKHFTTPFWSWSVCLVSTASVRLFCFSLD